MNKFREYKCKIRHLEEREYKGGIDRWMDDEFEHSIQNWNGKKREPEEENEILRENENLLTYPEMLFWTWTRRVWVV